jgi:hypothetical protein
MKKLELLMAAALMFSMFVNVTLFMENTALENRAVENGERCIEALEKCNRALERSSDLVKKSSDLVRRISNAD